MGTRQLRLNTYGMSEKEVECILAFTKLLAGIKHEWYVYASPCYIDNITVVTVNETTTTLATRVRAKRANQKRLTPFGKR